MSIRRLDFGSTDTGNNSTDFVTSTPTPLNSSSATYIPPFFTSGNDTVNLNARNLPAYSLSQTTDALGGNDDVTMSETQNIGVLFNTGDGNDTIHGSGNGDDMAGGLGNDTMTGGAGADNFVRAGNATVVQTDVITDFSIADDDTIDLTVSGPASFEVLNNHLLRTAGGNAQLQGIWNNNLQTLTLTGVATSALGAGDFVFDTSGTARNLTGSAGDDQLWGGLGNDTLSGGDGRDFFAGDAGNDSMSGGNGTDRFDGGAGADAFDGGAGLDRVDYNAATTLILNAGGVAQTGSSSEAAGDTFTGIEHIRGSALGDTIDVSTAVAILSGFDGNDTLTGGSGTNEINGGEGDDVINGGGASGAAMVGDIGNTRIYEILNGDAGNDTINVQSLTAQTAYANGGAGADIIVGGAGLDIIDGGSDNDQINGGSANDQITGGTGADAVDGGDGNDTIKDTDGMSGDSYIGGAGGDGIVYSGYASGTTFDFAAAGADTFDDTIEYITFSVAAVASGTAGIDRFNGSNSLDNADNFSGQGGRDWLNGGRGNDTLSGGADNDRLDGGLGADTLRGGAGSDVMTGGNSSTTAGDGSSDTYVFHTADMGIRDGIYDFEVGATDDIIALEGTGLAAGALDPSHFFTVGQTVNVTGPAIIYDQAKGLITYNSNGSAAGGTAIFAILFNNAALDADNFVLT